MSLAKTSDSLNFEDYNLQPAILNTLKKLNISQPTPIQAKSIPVAIAGQDLIGVAQTGTGKTLAFGIPMVQLLAKNRGLGLVLLPTRELASQLHESLRILGASLGLKIVTLVGGEHIGKQMMNLRGRYDIIVATPGRLLDHIKRRSVKLDNVKILVLDEADMMFDLGFAPQIEEIIKQTPKTRQTLMFSATMPAAIIKLATTHLLSPIHIEVTPPGTTVELIDQEIHIIQRDHRFAQLERMLSQYKGSVLVFVRTKHGATNLAEKLRRAGHQATEIHSNLSFNQRRNSMANFRSGMSRILIATDVASRGIDVQGIELVVNFDLPDNSEDYVHRIGRTARAGKQGKAVSFAAPNQRREIQKIERLIRKNLVTIEISGPKANFANNSGYKKPSTPPSRYSRPFRAPAKRAHVATHPDFSGLDNKEERPERRNFKRAQARPARAGYPKQNNYRFKRAK